MSVEQLNSLRSQSEAINQRRNAIRDAAADAVTADDSNVRMNVAGIGTGNYQQLVHQLDTMRNAAPVRAVDSQGNFTETDDQFNARVEAHAQRISDLENNLIRARNNTRDAIMEYALQNGGNFENINGQTINGVQIEAIDGHDNAILGRDRGIMATNYNTLNGMNIANLGLHDANGNIINVVDSLDDLNIVNTDAQDRLNNIDTVLQTHQQEVYDRHNSDQHRRAEANQQSVDSRRGNSGGNNNGGH